MKKIISLIMLVVCICLMTVGCSNVQQLDSSQIESPSKSQSIDNFSKQLEQDLNEQAGAEMDVQIITKGNSVNLFLKLTQADVEVHEFKQIIENDIDGMCTEMVTIFNGCLQKYHENGFNDIQLVVCCLDRRDIVLMRLISNEEIDESIVKHYYDGYDDVFGSDTDDSTDAFHEYDDYSDGLVNALRAEITYMETYYGKPLIKIDHKNKVVHLTYNEAPSELNILIDQNRWAYDEFETSYEMLADSVNEVVGYDYTTTVTVECDGRFVYSR